MVVVGAGPVGLGAAAHLLGRGLRPLVLEAGPQAGAAGAQGRHGGLFSQWSELVDPAARRLLEPTGWRAPDPDGYPT
ncbi:flavoprotein, partial [Saccharothrix sp. NRRL B-16348]